MSQPMLHSLATRLVALERLMRPRTSPDPASVRSILVLEYVIPLGNCVHMTPLFEAIKRARPEIRVSVATWGIGAQVLRNSPYIDDLLETPNALHHFWDAVSSIRRQLRSLGLSPDCCLTGAADHRRKVGLFGAIACNGWRGGYTLQPALYHRPLVYDRSKSLIDNNLRLAGLLGISVEQIEPKVFYSRQDAEVARKLIEPARAAGRPVLVAVTQTSGGLATAWHDDRWAQVLAHAHRELGYEILYVGTANDGPAITRIKEMADGVGISLAGSTNINQLAALIALSDMVITVTTGTMHVGRAAGTPMLVLNIAWEKPLEWMPSPRPQIRRLQGPLLETIPSLYKMDEISADWVASELADMSRLFPPDEALRNRRLQAGISLVDHLRR